MRGGERGCSRQTAYDAKAIVATAPAGYTTVQKKFSFNKGTRLINNQVLGLTLLGTASVHQPLHLTLFQRAHAIFLDFTREGGGKAAPPPEQQLFIFGNNNIKI